MALSTRKMTIAEYLEITVEGDRLQLIEGEVVQMDEPRLFHGLLQARLLTALVVWTAGAPDRGMALPPINVTSDDHNRYGPDLVWLPPSKVPADPRTGELEGMPGLAVEIRSPSTWRYNLGAKKRVYERSGLPELWLVDDRADTMLVYRRSSPDAPVFDVELELTTGDTLTSPALPGFAYALAELFA